MNRLEALDIFRKGATRVEFRRLALIHHPDRGGDAGAFTRLCEAWTILTGTKPELGNWNQNAESLFTGTIPMPREAIFQRRIKEALESAGAFVFNCHGSQMQRSGMPDLWVQHQIWCGWIELKTENTALEPIQEITIEKIRRRGGSAQVWRWKGGALIIQVPVSGVGIIEPLRVEEPKFTEGRWVLERALEAENECP
jgi:hypothetical protein